MILAVYNELMNTDVMLANYEKAKLIGDGYISSYNLVFKTDEEDLEGLPSIEYDENKSVPVVLWEIDVEDIGIFRQTPFFELISVSIETDDEKEKYIAITYAMEEGVPSMPSLECLKWMFKAYDCYDFDKSIIRKAVEKVMIE